MCRSLLSIFWPSTLVASFPHVLESSWNPPVPNPILESQVRQSSWLLLMIPILALDVSSLKLPSLELNPSLLHLFCNKARFPINFFHVARPSEVLRYCPSAIREYNELACLFMTMKLIVSLILIPRQILVKDVFQ